MRPPRAGLVARHENKEPHDQPRSVAKWRARVLDRHFAVREDLNRGGHFNFPIAPHQAVLNSRGARLIQKMRALRRTRYICIMIHFPDEA